MPFLTIPNKSTSIFQLEPLKVDVWIAGTRRTDAYCTEFTTSDNKSFGSASIWFPKAQYDSEMCLENDLVEVKIAPYGTVWRGYIVGRDSNISDTLVYTACDLLAKLDDTFFWQHEYNYTDEVSKEKKYPYTCRQIANDAYGLYLAWKTGTCDDDFLLSIDLESFPETVPNETKIIGQPLLQGLQSILETLDYRYRIKVEHSDYGSTIKAYILGAGTQKNVNRGSDPDSSYMYQESGPAIVFDINKTVSANNALTHVEAFGENRIIETALTLTQSWNLVPDNFSPPTGKSIKDYVTFSEQNQVINAWEKYTKEQIDIKAADKFNTKATNPNYRKKFERVCTHYSIPLVNDVWTYNDTANTTSFGEASKRVKIESELVQTFGDESIDHFLVYKRLNDPKLYVKLDGFSVKDNREVVFSQPFVDSYSTVLCKGSKGQYKEGSWSASNCTSTYTIADNANLMSSITETNLHSNSSSWLVLGETQSVYEIKARTSNTFSVIGNTEGAGVKNDKGEVQKGNYWYVLNQPVIYASGQAGVGKKEGKYQITSNSSEELNNKYSGMWLILGDYDFEKLGFKTAPKDLKTFRIASSSDKYLTIDNPSTDLTGAPSKWVIVYPQVEKKRPFEWIALNTSYKSGQRLCWFSGDGSIQPISPLRTQRVVYKENNDFKWTTEKNNYRLVKSSTDGEEDKYSVIYNPSKIDKKKDFSNLAAWAINQINGANAYEINYSITLRPMDFNIQVGDRILDNQIDSGATVTSIKYDLDNYSQNITASSWS